LPDTVGVPEIIPEAGLKLKPLGKELRTLKVIVPGGTECEVAVKL